MLLFETAVEQDGNCMCHLKGLQRGKVMEPMPQLESRCTAGPLMSASGRKLVASHVRA